MGNFPKAMGNMIHLEIDNFVQEVLIPQMQCQDPLARRIEERLLHNFYNMQVLDALIYRTCLNSRPGTGIP